MLRTVGFALTVCAIGILTAAWVQVKNPQQPQHLIETISPELLTIGHGPLPESKFNDMTFIFTH